MSQGQLANELISLGTSQKSESAEKTCLYSCDPKTHVAVIKYNRPHAMNAMNGQLRRELNAAFVTFRDDEDAWVGIVTGEGRAFCAGADLKEGGSGDAEDHSFWEIPSMTSLENGLEIYKPLIAAVNGPAVGYGCTLVSACDFVVASEKASFSFPEARIGVPTIQGSVRLPKKIGWQNAMELLLIGERVDAHRAKEMGLAGSVVPHEELMPKAMELAGRLAKSAPLAVRAMKEVAMKGQSMAFTDAIRFGETMRRAANAVPDATEGIKAAREKRTPTWTGKARL